MRAKCCVLQYKRLWAGAKVGGVGRAGAGYARAILVSFLNGRRVQRSRIGKQCAAYFWGMQLQIARRIGRRVHRSRNVWRIIGECNCRLPDALAGVFRGRGQDSNAWNIIGECSCRLPDALAGEFRGRGKEKFE